MSGNRLSIFAAYVILAVLLGCAESSAVQTPIPLTGLSETKSTSASANPSNHYLWGLYDITIDPFDSRATVVPMRIAEGHVNALRFLEVAPCSTCLSITSVKLIGNKEWEVGVQLKHPFVGLDKYTGFDVRGIVMFDGTYTFPGSGLSIPDPFDSSSGAFINTISYTTIFNPTDYAPGSAPWPAWEYQKGKMATQDAPSAALNPCVSYSIDNPRHYFGCDTADTKDLDIRFPSTGPLHFGYAVDASWAPPLNDPPKVPDDFPLEANMPEAYFLDFIISQNTLWIDPSSGGGGDIRFSIKVYDHQDGHLESDGGDVKEIRWEVPGMTGWDVLTPTGWKDGADSYGSYVEYSFVEAPVPDVPGPHRVLVSVTDKQTGLKDLPEVAYLFYSIFVASGKSCWSPGEMIAHLPSENLQVHLQNANCSYIDSDGRFNIFYIDNKWLIRHLVYYGPSTVTDEIVIPDEEAFNVNAVPDSTGAIHLLYSDGPAMAKGDIIHRVIDTSGVVGPPDILTATAKTYQFEDALAISSDGKMLAVWMDSKPMPTRNLCAAYYNGSAWTPEMTLKSCYLPDGWVNAAVVCDSKGVFHITYCDHEEMDIYYLQFSDGSISDPEVVVEGPYNSTMCVLSIDPSDNIYGTFEDNRFGYTRGFLRVRDSATGIWGPEVDLTGHSYYMNRFQNVPLPDGRLAVIWTDRRDGKTRSLYSKVFDPYDTEENIQSTIDDEIDAPSPEPKNQTRLCMSPDGTLHLVWSDERSGHYELYYSTCKP